MLNLKSDRRKREKWIELVQSLNPNIDPKAVRLMDEMRMTARTLHHAGETSVTATGLSYARYRLLMGLFFSEEVEGRSGLNPSEISERQGTSRNTISALIRELEDEGLVERSLDQTDRRKFNIRLTEDGRALVGDHLRKHFGVIGRCFGVLDEDEQKTLSRLLRKISASASVICERRSEVGSHDRGA